VRLPLSKLSEDMDPDDWMVMAREVVQAFGAGARGVVIAHGTDTMALSAAALSFVLRDLPGPVVLTGSQRSSDRPSSDSFSNLFHALELAARSDLGEVCVLMHATISDGISAVHRGTRVRKMHTSRRDAFRSINSEVLGTVSEKGIQLDGPYRRADPSSVPYIDGTFSKEVLLLNAQVTLDHNLLQEIGRSKRALVIAGTGLGHVSSSLVPVLKGLVSGGRPVVMASSCINGRVNMKVYSTGRDLLEAGVLEAGDMTPETALVKTMWCMGKIGPEGAIVERFRDLFCSDVAGEVEPRSVHSAFPEPSADEGRGDRTD
jgi:glutamyl-tRNA(Gln) amidotransferase subunit D